MKRYRLIAMLRTSGTTLVMGLLMMALLVMTSLIPLTLSAQPRNNAGNGNRGMMADSMHHEPFNLETIQTVKGKLVRVEQMAGRHEGMIGVHAVVDTGEEIITVHLGPLMNLQKEEFKLKEGEPMEATGSRITNNDAPALLATEITHGDQTLKLRDEMGKPVWRGMMQEKMKAEGKMKGQGMKKNMKNNAGGN